MKNATQHPALAKIRADVCAADKRFYVPAQGGGPGRLFVQETIEGHPIKGTKKIVVGPFVNVAIAHLTPGHIGLPPVKLIATFGGN